MRYESATTIPTIIISHIHPTPNTPNIDSSCCSTGYASAWSVFVVDCATHPDCAIAQHCCTDRFYWATSLVTHSNPQQYFVHAGGVMVYCTADSPADLLFMRDSTRATPDCAHRAPQVWGLHCPAGSGDPYAIQPSSRDYLYYFAGADCGRDHDCHHGAHSAG